MDRNIIILAGGASSRMKRSSQAGVDSRLAREAQHKAKAMIGVGDHARPFLDYLLFNIQKAGYENVIIVVRQNDRSVKEFYELQENAKQFASLQISYVSQNVPSGRHKPPGTADALLKALHQTPSWNGRRFTVCNSDNLYSPAALRLLLEDSHPNAMIDYDRAALQFREDRVAQFAVVVKDEEDFLKDIAEKPSPEEMNRAKDVNGRTGVSMNIWRFTYGDILPFLENVPFHPVRNEKELPVAVKMMIARHPRSVFAIPLSENVIDLTSLDDIPAVKQHIEKEFPHFGRK
ncbi:MAG TPA: sugar phosphate nucleotidyltransferase [Bacteroidota bacterium]|nr:sugar phosphate nucleotidyltransferase [Bacteroidota bacterium]